MSTITVSLDKHACNYWVNIVSQIVPEIFKGKEAEAILCDDKTVEEEDFPTYSQDSQEYMHWHYRLNHPTHTVMVKMAKQNMLPRRITKILVDMGKQHSKPPIIDTPDETIVVPLTLLQGLQKIAKNHSKRLMTCPPQRIEAQH